jgi:hypothetical protein
MRALPLLALLLSACGSDVGIYEADVSVCDGLLGPDEGEVVDGPWDADGDGYYDARNPDCAATYDPADLDCNDQYASINPGGIEVCDFLDSTRSGRTATTGRTDPVRRTATATSMSPATSTTAAPTPWTPRPPTPAPMAS